MDWIPSGFCSPCPFTGVKPWSIFTCLLWKQTPNLLHTLGTHTSILAQCPGTSSVAMRSGTGPTLQAHSLLQVPARTRGCVPVDGISIALCSLWGRDAARLR